MNEIGKTPGEVSKTLDVTGASVRNYVKHFKPFLSENATRKTRKRFSPKDIQTLKTAKSFLDAGLTYKQVSERLENLPATGEVVDEMPQPETIFEDIPPAEETITGMELLNWFEETLERQKELHQTAIDAKNEHIQELQEQNKRERLEKEQVQRQLNYERQPWFRKWFTERPE